MSISKVNYRKTFFLKLDLTRILGIPTHDGLHQIQIELKINGLSVYSKLGWGTPGHLVILMINTKYATLSPVLYVGPVHPGILKIPNNSARVDPWELKIVYKENLRGFHELRGVEHALIQQVVTAVDKQYIISIKNCSTSNITGNIRQIVAYLLSAYTKISSSHLNDFEKEVTDMYYDPVNTVDKIFNNIFSSTGTCKMSLFTPSGNLQGIQHP